MMDAIVLVLLLIADYYVLGWMFDDDQRERYGE